MARSENQKLKLLILKDYLLKNSDENHPVTVPQIIEELARYDIRAERKSIYDDLEALKLYGLDIIQSKGNYFVGQRSFQLPELKLLVDSVQSSKFISAWMIGIMAYPPPMVNAPILANTPKICHSETLFSISLQRYKLFPSFPA